MSNDDTQNKLAIDDEEMLGKYFYCHPGKYRQQIYNYRQQLIGELRFFRGNLIWSPALGDIRYSLEPQELDSIIRAHCSSPDRQKDKSFDDAMRKYVPLRRRRELSPEDLTQEQREKLQQLNARLMTIEDQLVREVLPQVEALKARVDNPDDWLEDFECDIEFQYSVGQEDPDFVDDENETIFADNMLMTVEHDFESILSMYRHRVDEGINWNEFNGWEGHPMRDEVHCWLYHDLYDHQKVGWANLLRIDEVWIDVHFRQQRWEKNLCQK